MVVGVAQHVVVEEPEKLVIKVEVQRQHQGSHHKVEMV